MKIAFAGKGGVGKTTLCAWTADYLSRRGHNVWLVDADTALSLGEACGLAREAQPMPLVQREDLIRERIGTGFINLTPEVDDLPDQLAVELPASKPDIEGIVPGKKKLLVMGTVAGAGGGCACTANSLLKALLAHLVIDSEDWVLVDLEAGVEHLGRGTVAHVDGLVVVSEPSRRGLETAATVGALATDLGLTRQSLALNRHSGNGSGLPSLGGLPPLSVTVPVLEGLVERQLADGCVLGLPERERVDNVCEELLLSLS